MPDQDVRGKSLLDLLWEKLDQYVDDFQLIAGGDNPDPEAFAEARGRAHAAAMCVALVTQPYHPSIADVKEQATERWELRQERPAEQVRTRNERTTSMTDAERRRRREQRQARRAARNG
jgi:hypothetical protein